MIVESRTGLIAAVLITLWLIGVGCGQQEQEQVAEETAEEATTKETALEETTAADAGPTAGEKKQQAEFDREQAELSCLADKVDKDLGQGEGDRLLIRATEEAIAENKGRPAGQEPVTVFDKMEQMGYSCTQEEIDEMGQERITPSRPPSFRE